MSALLLLSLTALGSVAIILTAVGVVLFRSGVRALAYWLLGWAALLEAGAVTLLEPIAPEIRALSPLFSTFVAPCMLLGACAHANRPQPDWILLVAFTVAAVRMATRLVGTEVASTALAIGFEAPLALAAAAIVLGSRRGHGKEHLASDRLLGVGFVLYAAVEAFDATSRGRGSYGWANWIAWIAVGLPLATIQIVLHLDRFGRRARRHEEDARALSARLDLLARSPVDFIAEFDESGTLTYVSPGAEIAAGVPASKLLGRNLSEFLSPTDHSPLTRSLRERGRVTAEDVAAAAGTDHLALLPDGSTRWFEFLGTPYHTLDGELRIVTRTRDVTSRVIHQQALRDSEDRLRRAERIAGVGSLQYDVETQRIDVSDELRRILGLEERGEPIDGPRIVRTLHPEDLERAIQVFRGSRDLGRIEDQVYRIVRECDGETRTLRINQAVDRDDDGRTLRVTAVAFDITEQVDLTNRLLQDQRRFEALVSSNVVCVYFCDAEWRIVEANDAFLSLLGFAREELPLELSRILVADSVRKDRALRSEPRAQQRHGPTEWEFVAKDGRPIAILLAWAELPPSSFIVIGTDLSERKRAEELREQIKQELEETVAVRTRELLESRSRLIEQERLAAVGTLAAGVAHQINNPIGAILNCAEYALLCRDDEEVIEIFERALRDNLAEAQRCAQIVKSMLQFSRDQPTAKWVEDLGRVVRRAHRAISAHATDRGARIDLIMADDAVLTRMSPIEIEQAIVNVLRNAIESRETGANVTLALSRRDKSALIEVTDDGRGIPPEHQERLFEPFFSTRTRDGGTGLGLSVTHGVVIDHGGEVRVESVPDVGTRVLISLPLEESLPGSRGDESDAD